MANIRPTLVFNLLECRIGSYTTQYFMHLAEIREILHSRADHPLAKPILRIILRSNRMAAYMKAENHFQRIGYLGSGSFGTVELVKLLNKHKYYALKTVFVKQRRKLTKNLVMAHIERDCAIVANTNHFVKLKAAWMEFNNGPRPDCFRFLWENMPCGNLKGMIEQLHPMSYLKTSFTEYHRDTSFFSFHDGTCNTETDCDFYEEEYIDDDPLIACLFAERKIIAEGGRLFVSRQATFRYLQQLLEAVHFLHSRNIVHRDIKPANVLVAGDLSLRVADLGLATHFNPKHFQHQHKWAEPDYEFLKKEKQKQHEIISGADNMDLQLKEDLVHKQRLDHIGTRVYLGPEHGAVFYQFHPAAQFNTLLSKNTDYYAVGIVVFELLTGYHPITTSLYIFIDEILEGLRHLPREYLEEYVKMDPRHQNPLLYPLRHYSKEAFESLFLDMGIHRIITKLMDPNPRTRADYASLAYDSDFLELSNEMDPSGPLMFTWNSYVRQPRWVPFDEALARNAMHGNPPEVAPPAEWSQIFAQPGFPIMTDSPGTIASP